MRLRSDSWHRAGQCRARCIGALDVSDWEADFVAELDGIEPAELGDVWMRRVDGILMGYGLTCPAPRCRDGVHFWTHGFQCPRSKSRDAPCKFAGQRPADQDSCWLWSGSVEAGNLTAVPSLHVVAVETVPLELRGCGFHGWQTNGVLQ